MRFKQYIIENNNSFYTTLKNGIKTIYTHCKPYIKDICSSKFNYTINGDTLLLSGRELVKDIIIKDIRIDRKPTDTSYSIHDMMDCAFNNKFGWKARSNSIFCSGAFDTAEGYGLSIYIIFPVGKYKILWSPKVRDLYYNVDLKNAFIKDKRIYLTEHESLTIFDFNKLPCDSKYKKNLKETSEKIVNTYKLGDIKNAIQSKHEIMMTSKKYVGLKYNIYYPYIYQYITTNQQNYSDELFDKWYEIFIGE